MPSANKKNQGLLQQLQGDVRFQDGLTCCIQCGICTAVCPAANFYDYDPRKIAVICQRGNEEELEQLLRSDTIWYCGECLSCKTRCPRGNTPGYLIQSLRNLSQINGMFASSRRGRQQLEVVRLVGENMLRHGYCVYVDNINTANDPEQGPVWDWFRKHTGSIMKKLGGRYHTSGAGTLRNIDAQDLDELRNIFAETGALDRFDSLKQICNDTGREAEDMV